MLFYVYLKIVNKGIVAYWLNLVKRYLYLSSVTTCYIFVLDKLSSALYNAVNQSVNNGY